MKNMIKSLLRPAVMYSFLTCLLCLLAGIPNVNAEFDPVNDDTDIFLANPNVPSNRPNVLIYVDNTANWNSAFTNEKNALVTVVDNLSDLFNVGLMMFPETGNPNDNVDGAYIRYAIRQMKDENKSVLSSLVNGFDIGGDKGNNATTGLGMAEVYRYFSGSKSRASHGKVKTDYASNTSHPATAAGLGEHALPASPTSNSNYTSPIGDSCQSNFLIYISNGPASENANASSTAQSELTAAGYNTSSTISLTPNGQQGNWMDEWSKFMANADINPNMAGMQNLTTYVVEVDPGTTGQGPSMTALMKSVALNGNGEYFAVSSNNAGQAIVNALNSIFREIQAVNSVFASTTLPVSVNVRGTNLNQVYIGVFRPDETKSPRWYGNLKMYQLGFDNATSTLFLADAAGSEAENPETGFINANSASFWTEASTFWSFRTADENGAGGSSDLPDGDLVEKGGTAQQQRKSYATDQSTRELYTCNGSCTNGSLLSDTPFATSNTNITNGSLGLGTVAVSTLTGFATKTATAIVDTFNINSLNTAAGSVSVAGLSTNAVGKTITGLTTVATKPITAMTNSPVQKSFNSLNRGSGSIKDPVTAVINNHGYTNGQLVHIAGVGSSEYNGSKIITVVDANTFKYSTGTSNPTNNPTITGATATTTSTIVNVTVNSHGLNTNDTVTIAGVVPTDFNGTYTINKINDNQFSFTTASTLAPVTSIASATITANSSTATATVASHGYATNSQVVISGSSVSAYNGTHTITSTGTNTFTFPVGASQANDTSGAAKSYAGTATVTASAAGHTFINGQTVSISGGNPASYNGSFDIFNVVPGVSFQYTAPGSGPNTGTGITAASGVSTTVTATVPNHKFSFGDVINVSGAVPNDYNGIHTVISVIDANTFKYSISTTPTPATTAGTIRLNSPTAFATVTGHGYTTGDLITIRGATPSGYNRNDVGITVVDANTFKYPLASTLGTAATGTLQSLKKGLVAQVRAVNHGFNTDDNIAIAGAAPSGFNGSFNITKVDDNNFTYPLSSAQGDASGSITASSGSGSGSARSNLINWVRGADNQEDENSNGSNTDIRASIQGDVLHSRPAVINYNRHGNDNDVFVFFGANDGIFRAVKGGFNQSAVGEANPGQEVWGFIPEEFFPELERLRNNEPKISSSNKKPYFADGTIAVLSEDNSGPDGKNVPDGKLDTSVDDNDNPDRVYLYVSMRRGGRFIYALDVSDPDDPRFLWKKSYKDLGMEEMGYTWSAPRVVTLNANDGEPVLLFGAGYDPEVEDVTPADVTSLNDGPHTEVTAGSAIYTRTMGRGIFALDAKTGDIIWQAGPEKSDPTSDPSVTHYFLPVDGMDYSIPSDLTVIRDRNGSISNRAYVGDTGGNVWRIDMEDANVKNWTVNKLASLADHSDMPSGNRKFMFPPDVVYSTDGYDAVLIGSGDREHPFDETVVNRFYMLKDPNIGTKVDSSFEPIIEKMMFDSTSNCIQDGTACSGTGDETDSSSASDALATASGWYVTLGEGEKVVGNAVTLNNVTFFNTNQPGSSADVTDCSSDLGIARQYKVRFDNATAIVDQNIDGITDAADRSKIHAGGGYLPSPVPVVVEIDGQIHEGVISGVAVDEPPGSLLNARLRRFWYKEME